MGLFQRYSLFAVCLLAFFSVAVSAQTNLASCQILGTPNEIYILTQDISSSGTTCFTVQASNITLDCQNHSITGKNNTGEYGVYTGQFGTTVRNCRISNFDSGIVFDAADSGRIENCRIGITFNYGSSSTYAAGIALLPGSESNIVLDSSASSRQGMGGLLFYSSFNRLENSTFESGIKEGFYVGSSSNNLISGIYSKSGSEVAFYLYNSSNNSFSNCTAKSASNTGFRLDSRSNNNTFQGISINAGTTSNGHGFYINGGNGTVIDCQNRLIYGSNSDGSYGIYSSQAGTQIRNCNIANFEAGIFFDGAKGSTISGCNINSTHADGRAIFFDNQADNNTISGCTARSANYDAIRLSTSSNPLIQNTIAYSGSGYGINVKGPSLGTRIFNSNATSASSVGISICRGSNQSSIENVTAKSGSSYGLHFYLSSGATVRNTSAVSTSGQALYTDNLLSATFANCTGYSQESFGAYFGNLGSSTVNGCVFSSDSEVPLVIHSSSNNHFSRNKFVSGNGNMNLVQMTGSNSNHLYYNNFTSTSGAYLRDVGGSNNYSILVGGADQGNYWANIRELDINDSNSDGWGDYGTEYPYSQSNSNGKFIGSGADFGPAVTTGGISQVVDVSILSFPNVTNATKEAAAISGACSENGMLVYIKVSDADATTAHIFVTALCQAASWSSTLNLASLSDGLLNASANHSNSGGATAYASKTSLKNTSLEFSYYPYLSIDSFPAVNSSNKEAVQLSGKCSENGFMVYLGVSDSNASTADVEGSATCISTSWAMILSLASLSDGTLTASANFTDSLGRTAYASKTSEKNTSVIVTAPTLTISSFPNVTNATKAATAIGGACSENGRLIYVSVSDANASTGDILSSTSCASGLWSATLDFTSLSDGILNASANHSNAGGQTAYASKTSVKNVSIEFPYYPYLSIDSFPAVTNSNKESVYISGRCSEGNYSVFLSVSDSDAATAHITSSVLCIATQWSSTLNLASLSDGALAANANFTDSQNRTAFASRASTKDTHVPPTPPTPPGPGPNPPSGDGNTGGGPPIIPWQPPPKNDTPTIGLEPPMPPIGNNTPIPKPPVKPPGNITNGNGAIIPQPPETWLDGPLNLAALLGDLENLLWLICPLALLLLLMLLLPLSRKKCPKCKSEAWWFERECKKCGYVFGNGKKPPIAEAAAATAAAAAIAKPEKKKGRGKKAKPKKKEGKGEPEGMIEEEEGEETEIFE